MLFKVPFFLSLVCVTVSQIVNTTQKELCDTSTTAVDGAECDFVTSDSDKDVPVSNKNFSTAKETRKRSKWDRVDVLLKPQTRGIWETFNVKDVIARTNVSDLCKAAIGRYLNSLSDLETWAIKMWGASGRLDSGDLFLGRFASFGSFDECLRIGAAAGRGEGEIRGQYCMVRCTAPPLQTHGEPPKWIQDFLLRNGLSLQEIVLFLGTCVPSTCSDQDLTQIITHIVAPFELAVDVLECQVAQPVVWSNSLVAAVCFLSGIGLLCVLGTAADIRDRWSTNGTSEKHKNNPSKLPKKLLKMFSVPFNLGTLLSEEVGEFACLDGIRFLSSAWIVLFHSYCVPDPLDFRKFSNGLQFERDFSGSVVPNAAVDNALMAVASFFFLSGFLMSNTTWKKLEKGRKINFFDFFLHKYWRMTPCLVLTLAVFAVVVATGSGPLWNTVMASQMETCSTSWWRTFLYIGNWWDLKDNCLMHMWFVPCLMQLNVMGFILLHITFRWARAGVLVGVAVVLGCGALVVTTAVRRSLPLPTSLAQNELDNWGVFGWCNLFRLRPHFYVQSYAIGMIAGYSVLKLKNKNMKRIYQAIGWTLSTLGSFYAVFGVYGPGHNVGFKAFYYGANFTAWSLSLGWLVYACISGYGGVVNRCLSWRGFHFLSNISYLTYLFHFVLIYGNNGALRDTVPYGHYEMFCSFLSNMAISTFLAFLGHVTFEMPFSHLEKVIL